MNDAGGVLTGRPGNHRAFAESQAGINYALDMIARVAKGQRGQQAISSIVSRFERPANIPGEIAKAFSRYGGPIPQGGMPLGGQPAPNRPNRSSLALSLISQGNQMFGLDPLPTGIAAPSIPLASRPAGTGSLPGSQPYKRGKTIRWLEHFAGPYGLQVTSTTTGKHAKNSYHYRGRAVDFGGDPQRMAALAQAALSHPQDFSELFYTGPGNPGAYIKNGKVYPNSSLDRSIVAGHTTHVHAAR